MSHDHHKKHSEKHEEQPKKHHGHHGHDKGKLSDAMKNKDDADYDEMTPGIGDPAKAKKDIKGQAEQVDNKQVDGRTRIVINRGSDDGVTSTELDASLTGGDGQTYSVSIESVSTNRTVAWVETTYANIIAGDMWVLINPSKK